MQGEPPWSCGGGCGAAARLLGAEAGEVTRQHAHLHPHAAFAGARAAAAAMEYDPFYGPPLKKAAGLMRAHAQPMADCLVKEIAKPAKDSLTEVVR